MRFGRFALSVLRTRGLGDNRRLLSGQCCRERVRTPTFKGQVFKKPSAGTSSSVADIIGLSAIGRWRIWICTVTIVVMLGFQLPARASSRWLSWRLRFLFQGDGFYDCGKAIVCWPRPRLLDIVSWVPSLTSVLDSTSEQRSLISLYLNGCSLFYCSGRLPVRHSYHWRPSESE